jgi:hypothetical protein
VPAQVSDWLTRLSEPVRVRSRHPALDQFYRSAVYCEEFRFAVMETGDIASLRLQGETQPDHSNIAIAEIKSSQYTAHVTITEYDGLF